MSLFARAMRGALAIVLVASVAVGIPGQPVAASVLPSGFQEEIVFPGLDQPTNIEFAPDQRVFVAEKKGVIKVFESLANPTPTVFANLSGEVHSLWDRGLLGLALSPNFPTDPWVYVLYAHDPLGVGQQAACVDPSAGNCVVNARLSRLRADGNHMTGTEEVLLEGGWCQQFASHSIGDLKFGSDGALYVSAGDGASFGAADAGQLGNPVNPCGDPPGGAMTGSTAEGGALRSQDVRTAADPAGLSGALLRLDPSTGAAMADNPSSSADANARRIVAYGLRNPFRFTVRPGTNELWVGDVGWNAAEEIDRVLSPTGGVANFGWPCFEGEDKSYAFDTYNLCGSLYANGGQPDPYYAYPHGGHVVAGETCTTAGGAVTGLAFYPTSGGPYPAAYQGALFFADYARNCIWAMKASTPGGLPNPVLLEPFVTEAATPVDVAVGPDGVLYYADLTGGTVRRIRYFAGNQPPVAVISSSATGGAAPLTVSFDGSGSIDPDPDLAGLSYAWDFDDNGTVDSTSVTASHTYTTVGTFTARLTVTDGFGASGSATVAVTPGNDAPTAVIDTPAAATTWRVGDTITFSGHASDLQDGTLPASKLRWRLRMQHCAPSGECHVHFLQEWQGVSSGSFVAPDHEYPSYLELELTATDSAGLTHTVTRRLNPKTVGITFASDPPGLSLTVGDFTGEAPFTRTAIQGSKLSVSAGSPLLVGVTTYNFVKWSDGLAAAHIITAPTSATTRTASYEGSYPTNLALGKPATGSTPCDESEGPANAVNGSWTGGSTDRWCSTAAPQWLQVDLGSVTGIGGFVVRHAGAGGEAPSGNTKNFTIQVSSNGTNWTTIVTVTGNTADVTTHVITPVNGRYVRLNVGTPSGDGSTAAYIYEFEVLAGLTKPPPPKSTGELLPPPPKWDPSPEATPSVTASSTP